MHVVTLERRIFEDIVNQRQCPNCQGEGEPSGDVVAEEVEKMDATEEVADDREKVRPGPACEEVAEELMENEPHQHQGNVGAWSKVVLNAPGLPRGVMVPVVHLVHSDPL